MTTVSWKAAVDGSFADPTNWDTGTVPVAGDSAKVTVSGTYTVTSSVDENMRNLTLGSHSSLAITGGIFGIGVIGSGVPLTVLAASSVSVAPGAILQIGFGGVKPYSTLEGSLTIGSGAIVQFVRRDIHEGEGLMGGGTISMLGPDSEIDIGVEGLVTDVTISGAGKITSTSTEELAQFRNNNLINGNQSGSTLTITTGTNPHFQTYGDPALLTNFYNFGTLEATNGGGLELAGGGAGKLATIANAPVGLIQAIGAGSHVDLNGAVIWGGMVTTSGGGVVQTLAGGGTLWGIQNAVTNAGTVRVNDGTTLSLLGTIHNTGTIALEAAGDPTGLRLQSLGDFSGPDTTTTLTVTLDGGGSVIMSDNAANRIYATHVTTSLVNTDNTISGAGQIGLGTMTLTNRGTIDANGTNALLIDAGTKRTTNGAFGLLEGSGSGGLFLAGAKFTNNGTIAALDGSSVTVGSGTTLTNNSAGTLTGGHWTATDAGDGATLTLAGSAVTVDAATIILSGASSVLQTGSTLLEDSLSTIAAKGKLELLANRSWTSSSSFTDNGFLQLAGGSFDAADLTVGAGGSVRGFGTIAPAMTNDGTIEAKGGTLLLSGDVHGSGTLQIDGASSLETAGTLDSTENVLFHGVHATLKLHDTVGFNSTISGWAPSDTIDLLHKAATFASIVSDTLHIDLAGGGSLDYKLTGSFDNTRLVLASDHNGGTNITLARA